MPKLTVKDLIEAKGKRWLTHVQVARVEEAAGMDMPGTGFRAETLAFPAAAQDTHFRFGLAWGQPPRRRRRCVTPCARWRRGPIRSTAP